MEETDIIKRMFSGQVFGTKSCPLEPTNNSNVKKPPTGRNSISLGQSVS